MDFGCFSTSYGDCEALEEREEQVKLTLLLCVKGINPKSLDIYIVYIGMGRIRD